MEQSQQSPMPKMQTSPEELFALIGEREVIKFKQGLQIQQLYMQIEEMSEEITRLREALMDHARAWRNEEWLIGRIPS